VIEMAFKSIRVSDLTGAEGSDEEFVSVIVRRHPAIEEPVVFDAKPEELKGLKNNDSLVVLEVKNGGEPVQVVTTVSDFAKLSAHIDEVLKSAPSPRGRRPGFRPQPKD
jgi:hypothetical protein